MSVLAPTSDGSSAAFYDDDKSDASSVRSLEIEHGYPEEAELAQPWKKFINLRPKTKEGTEQVLRVDQPCAFLSGGLGGF